MDGLIVSPNSVIFITAVMLTFISTYTAIELLLMMRTTKGHMKRFLYLGSSFALGIAIWTLNFFNSLIGGDNRIVSMNVAISVLAFVLGTALAAMGFLSLSKKKLLLSQLLMASFLLSMAVFSSYIIGMYALQHSFAYNVVLLGIPFAILFCLFVVALLILFYPSRFNRGNTYFLKLVSTLVMTGAITQGHFLLLSAFPINHAIGSINELLNEMPFIMYLLFFVSLLVLSGLITSSTIINRRLAKSDNYVKDIRFALDQSSIVAITDPQGIITYVNDKFVEISKYSEEELLGQSHSIINSGYHPKEFFGNLWSTIKQGRTWSGEICNKDKYGNFYWVHTTIVPFMDHGKPYQFISIRSDITRRKQAEQDLKTSIRELQDIYNALNHSSIVMITDKAGKIVQVNDQFIAISGYTAEELIGRSHSILQSDYYTKALLKEIDETVWAGKVWKGELRNLAKDGREYWVDATIVPYRSEAGKPTYFLSILHDITERKKSEELLHQQDKLAAVGQLAAGVAHEIRNPLTSMKGYTEFLQLDEKDPTRLEYLDIILDEIDRVNQIVEEFLVLAKPQSVKLETKNIVPIIQNVLSLMEFDARKKKVNFYFENMYDFIFVRCDENRLKQVFLNFVKNGIEAMPNGGHIKVTTELKEGEVQISFEDTGVGIPPDRLKKLGEPFYTTKETGNGLGLMVSFKIIESHQGRIVVESEVNKGTAFNILLPLETA
ncbi:PAS domain S-box protein [Peribacillus asahii]|nr:PAS domain S-box protein [Peribacillus asahii]USK83502.1 PAS domain S-box protein [Peribacillus asahii]